MKKKLRIKRYGNVICHGSAIRQYTERERYQMLARKFEKIAVFSLR